jgi:hypothetical protein
MGCISFVAQRFSGFHPCRRDYTQDVQRKAAEGIVGGLNTHNPDDVELLRFEGQPGIDATNTAIRQNIT